MPAKGQEHMDETALWTSHLKPGESLVWSASVSPALVKAARDRARLIGLGSGIACTLITVLLAARFLESVSAFGTADIGASLLTPLYLVFTIAMAALALWGFRNMRAKLPATAHFAATNLRLLALDPSGAITDELAAADIDGVIAGGRPSSPSLFVFRKGDDKDERTFPIEHIERPLEAKAIIEEHFLEPAAVEPAP
jgi:hypothetical protein